MSTKDIRFAARPLYRNSRALVVGINDYKHAPKLGYAVSDAEAIKNLLTSKFGFRDNAITFLADKAATRSGVLRSFAKFASDAVELDDRIIFFFAGHGHTLDGFRGSQGFLVPSDGKADDISTLISWRELMALSDLIRAKHMFFIMDACYSGLALTRSTTASSRFLKDMMRRYSRQVLTAGKADETVKDSGGPLPGHSVFTGHLIEGLQGSATTDAGVISAASVMSYVYNRVANDRESLQTPHFGHVDGDGDFVFSSPEIDDDEVRHEQDLLVSIPFAEVWDRETPESKAEQTKDLLSQDIPIKLHDFAISEVKSFMSKINDLVSKPDRSNVVTDLLLEYEESADALATVCANVAFWARPEHLALIQKLFSRSLDLTLLIENERGLVGSLKWHPLLVLIYTSAIAAIEGGNYGALRAILYAPAPDRDRHSPAELLAERISAGITRISESNPYKNIPGHERHFVPMSEYLFKLLQPRLEDTLYIGSTYESSFDEFEILIAMVVLDLSEPGMHKLYVYPHVGRFGWKHGSSSSPDNSPLTRIAKRIAQQRENWPPLHAGFFDGNKVRAEAAVSKLLEISTKRHH